MLGNAHARDAGPVDRVAARLRRPLDRRFLRRFGRLDELERMSREAVAATTPRTGPRVLVLALRAFPNHTAYELTIAHALRLRGAEVALLTCGGGQPACEMGWQRRTWPRACDRCAWFTDELTEIAGLPAYHLRDGLPWGADARRAPHGLNGLRPGVVDPVKASGISVPWFLHTSAVDEVPEGPAAAADYQVAVAGVERSATRVLDDFRPDVVFMVNGLFAAERTIRQLALERGIRAPTYEMPPRQNTLFLCQDEPAARYVIDSLWERVRDRPLTDEQLERVERLLADRATGAGAYQRFFDQAETDVDALRRTLAIEPGKRVISLFTNLTWDSATLERNHAFDSMVDWMAAAIRTAGGLDDAVLVVRVHPADARWGSREDAWGSAVRLAGGGPDNVRVIRPRDPLSSYALLDMSDQVLVYASTTGLEAANRGIPVAVAAKVHYRERGFTWDLDRPADLEGFMAAAGLEMDQRRTELARRYAFTYFFRASIPFPVIDLVEGRPERVPDSAAAIAPGADPYLDLICDRLLDGGDFYVPDELALREEARPAAEDELPTLRASVDR
jgi:hypothetical protein